MSRLLLGSLLLVLAACPPPPQPATIGYFRGQPLDISPGESVQLTWESFNASSCTIAPDVGTVGGSGATLVNPQETITYVLECGGAKRSVSVSVRPKFAITSLTTSSPEVVPDGVARLTWATTSAQNCTIEPDVGEVDANGSAPVVASMTTTYSLTCSDLTNAEKLTSTVTVNVVPRTTTLAVPAGLQLTPHDGWVRISWTQGEGSGAVYVAEAAITDVGAIATLPGGRVLRRQVSPLDLPGLVSGRSYHVRVAAMSGADESAPSAEQSVTIPTPAPVTDPFFKEQWHLVNLNGEDVNVSGPWGAGVLGEDVKVAVVDEGVDLKHEDLWQNTLYGFHKDYLGTSARSLAEHGTCVAGLIAARDGNGLGVRGVAPRAGLMSFNVLQALTSRNEYDSMVREKELVGVSNNSWGDAADGTGLITPADPQWLRGVEEGATQGRNGKGVVYFWASGNGADVQPGEVFDDSNFDSQANNRFVIAVGGVGKNGVKASYAEGGANVLIVAPTEGQDGAGLVTTDITGSAGYNRGGDTGDHPNAAYTRTFNGTSGATPIAAGVGALVLQARPELGYRDVRRVLARSARQVDPTSADWATTAAGHHVHHGYGFGVVDAAAAVALARTIELVGPEQRWSGEQSPGLAIPDATPAGVTSTLTVTGSGIRQLDVLEVEVTIAHDGPDDLEVVLEKAGSVSDVLHPLHHCSDPYKGTTVKCTAIDGFVFTSVRHLDEPGDGTWTLRVKDLRAGTTGTLTNWKLRLYGSP